MFDVFCEEADVSIIFPPNTSEKIGGLYLGSLLTVQHTMVCKFLNIQSVISLTDSDSPRPFNDQNDLKLSQEEHMVIKVNDSKDEDLEQYFLSAFEFIEEKRCENKNVLVHCTAGCSRSPAIIIGYLMETFDWTLQEAFKFVQEKRPFISPNENFMNQLAEFENKIVNGLFDLSQQNISISSLDSM